MKILLVTTHLNIGGIASYVVSLAKGLSQGGHKVFVASSGGDFTRNPAGGNVIHVGIPISTKSELSPKVLFSAVKLLMLAKRESIELIHAHTRVTQVLACLVSGLAGIPCVSTCHGFFKTRIGRRLFGAWGNKVIAISDPVREHLVNDFKVQKEKIELVYNGIDFARFRDYPSREKDAIKREFNLAEGPVVGIIARLSSVKGHKFLIEAMGDVIKKIPAAQLLIIGDGPMKDDMISLAEAEGIRKNTYFVESVFDTARPLSVMDVFVLPSLQEGLGLSIIEALAMRRAVVASDVGGVYTIIKDHSTGLLVPPRDSKALAGAILRLLKDGDLRERLGREGRKLVEEKFSLDLMVKQVEAVYCKAGER